VVTAVLSLLMMVLSVIAAPSTSAAQRRSSLVPRTLLIVAGQSNASGMGSRAVDPTTHVDYLKSPYTNNADSVDTIMWEPWGMVPMPSQVPVNLDTPQDMAYGGAQVFGPEIGLARQVWADTRKAVTIVKVADPGTPIADWGPTVPGGTFDSMVTEVRAAESDDAHKGYQDTIGGFYLYEGEGDSKRDTPGYATGLGRLIQGFRASLSETAPVGLVKSSLAHEVAYYEATNSCPMPGCTTIIAGDTEVRAADDWAVGHLRNVAEADSLGLPRWAKSRYVHLNDVGELKIGEDLAKATDRLPGF